MMSLLSNRAGLTGVLIAVTFVLYCVMLPAPFKTLDDQMSIVENPLLRDAANIPEIFTSSFFGDRSYYRPFVTFTYFLEFQTFGLASFFYNLTNLFIHIGCSLLLFSIAGRLTRHLPVAFLTALLFAIHPVQWEAVSNIAGRSILLNALLCLASFRLFLDVDRGKRWLAGSLVCFLAALLSKESAGVFPLVIAAYLFLCRRGEPWHLRLVRLAPYFVVVALYILWRKYLGLTEIYPWRNFNELSLGVLSALRGVVTFLRLLVLPVDLHFYRSQALFTSFTNPQILFTLSVLALGGLFLWRMRRSLVPLMWFGLAWFVIELVPVLQIVTAIGTQPGYISIAEHFLYLASAGIFFAIVLGAHKFYVWNLTVKKFSPYIQRCVVAGFLAFLALTTLQMNISAREEWTMMTRSAAFEPHNVRVQYSLGLLNAQAGRLAEAEEAFRRAALYDPTNIRSRIALAKTLCDSGRCLEGIRIYEAIRDAGGLNALLQENIRLSYAFMIRQYEQKLEQTPDDPELYFALGVFYAKLGHLSKMMEANEEVLRLKPDHPQALFNLASGYEAAGQTEDAVAMYERFLALAAPPPDLIEHARSHLAALKAAVQR